MLSLQPCDFGVVDPDRKGPGWLIGQMICAVESREALGDPRYDHAIWVLNSDNLILNTVWPRTRKDNLSKYIGHRVLLGRYKYLDDKGRKAALALAETFVGKRYPVSRLVLDLFNAGRFVHGIRGDCSEVDIRLLYAATGIPNFENWAAWMPSELAEVIREWHQFDVIFDGILSEGDVK